MLDGHCNNVEVFSCGGRRLVRKTYAEKLKDYSESWPLSRREAEAGAYRVLSEIVKNHPCVAVPGLHEGLDLRWGPNLAAPAGLDFGPDSGPDSVPDFGPDRTRTLTMDFIDAPSLAELLSFETSVASGTAGTSGTSRISAASGTAGRSGTSADAPSHGLPSVEVLTDLFRVLKEVQEISWSSMESGFRGSLIRQQKIAACMYRNKHRDYFRGHFFNGSDYDCPAVLTRPPWKLCLGDVSLNNILWDGSRLWLLDHECVHMGYSGYDAGQILGMTESRISSSPASPAAVSLYFRLNQAFLRSNPEEELELSVRTWQDSFYSYYLR